MATGPERGTARAGPSWRVPPRSVASRRSMEPVVHLRATVALLGRFPALAGIDLDVVRGEIVLLRGPNGAGKTTLLRALRGPGPARCGARRSCSATTCRPRPGRCAAGSGLLGHATGLFEDLTVADNVTFWGRACRAAAATSRPRSAWSGWPAGCGTSRSPGCRPASGARASLACLLARRPELWLLDEPHAGLDNEARDLLDGLVRQAVGQGATVVLSSHELDRAEALADRVVDLVPAPPGPPAARSAERAGRRTTRPEATHVA